MPGTEDLFTPVHKGLRSMMYGLSARLQTTDFADHASTKALTADLEHDFDVARSAGCALCLFANHAFEEEAIVFPPTARHGNALVTSLIAEHHELTRQEVAIATSMHELDGLAAPAERITAGIRVNQMSNDLFAAYLTHMNREERELVPLMREHFTDEEQAKMRGAIIGRFPPDRLFALLGWMLPALNVTELSDLLRSVKQSAPPPFMKAVSDLCATRVEPHRWTEVKRRVGI